MPLPAEPSALETALARAARNLAIPRRARTQKNPLEMTAENLQAGREDFLARCAICHGHDGSGRTPVGRNLYPRAPDLRSAATQKLTDGEIHYIIENGVELTGMPAWGNPHRQGDAESWKLVLFIRSLGPLANRLMAEAAQTAASAHYVGSQACGKCHQDIYRRWKKTPMANVVRDPRQHPEALIPNLATNRIAPFSIDQVAFVYGSIWKQRYFTKRGNDYFPLPVQWEIGNHRWSRYFVPQRADWWAPFYPPDNRQRPTGPTCDGCHDVHGTGNYAQLRKPADALCLDCHGPLSPNGPRTATLEEHTHHRPGSPGAQCVACHMPQIETEGVPGTFVHAHTFRFITPAMTEKYGIPNSCTSCHTGKSTAWATQEMRRWDERSPWRLE